MNSITNSSTVNITAQLPVYAHFTDTLQSS